MPVWQLVQSQISYERRMINRRSRSIFRTIWPVPFFLQGQHEKRQALWTAIAAVFVNTGDFGHFSSFEGHGPPSAFSTLENSTSETQVVSAKATYVSLTPTSPLLYKLALHLHSIALCLTLVSRPRAVTSPIRLAACQSSRASSPQAQVTGWVTLQHISSYTCT